MPTDAARALLVALGETIAGVGAVLLLIARGDVLHAQRKRIDAKFACEGVHRDLESDRAFGVPWRAKGGHRRGVHVCRGLARAHVGAGVEFVIDRTGAALGAAHANGNARIEIDRGEATVARGAKCDALPGTRAIPGVDLLTRAIHDAGDGAAESLGEDRGNVGVRAGEVLRAESAAHRLADHAHVGERDAECLGDVVAHAVDALRALPDGEAVAVPLGDGAVRLHRAVQRAGCADLARDGHLSGGERLGDIAALEDERLAPDEVVLDPRSHRAALECLLDGDGEGERLDRGAHESCGGAGDLLRDRTDCGDGLAGVGDLGIEEPCACGHVGGDQQVEHAGERARGTEVDLRDAAARHGGAHDRGVGLIRASYVGRVSGAPGRFERAVRAESARADVRELCVRAPGLGLEGWQLHDALLGASLHLDRGGDEAALGSARLGCVSHWSMSSWSLRRDAQRARSWDRSRSDRDCRSGQRSHRRRKDQRSR